MVWKERTHSWGLSGALYQSLMDFLGRHFDLHLFHVNRRPHLSDQDIPEEVASNFRFAVLSASEVLRCAGDPELDFSREFAEAALARGDWCFGVFLGDRLVAYDWRALRGPVELAPGIDVGFEHPGQTYGYKMFTHPDFRGYKLQLYSLRYGEARLRDAGHTHTIGYVATQNFASRRALGKAKGNAFVGLAGYVRLFGRCCTFRTPGASQYGFALFPASRLHGSATESTVRC